MGRRWVGFAGLLVIGALLVGASVIGSSEDSARTSTAPIPSAVGATSGPGSPLRDGLSVATGTALVGDPFTRPWPLPSGGWRAYLLVLDDPRSVMRKYIDQAERLGFAMRTRTTLCAEEGPEHHGFYSCVATGSSDTAYLEFQLARGTADYGPVSHLQIEYGTQPGALLGIFGAVDAADAAAGPKPPPVPRDWPSLGGSGDWAFGDSGAPAKGFGARSFKIEPGSAVAAPPGPAGVLSGSYDWAIVVSITGDPETVADHYIRQLNRNQHFGTASTKPRVSNPEAGVTHYQFHAESLGDADHHFDLVHSGDRAWMLVQGFAQT